MGIFSKPSQPSAPAEPVLSREELTRIAANQQSGNFMDPGRGPAQQDGRVETVRGDFQ
jgi:hypothetical protein